VLFAETVKTEVSCGKMLSLKEMACASIKTRLREQFMQMVMHRLDPTARSKNLPRCLDSPETAEFDFDDIFCQVLHNNGAKTQDVVTDSFDFLIWDDADEDKSNYFKFISSILNVHRQHHIAYMSFLSFVVKRNPVLARKVFRHPHFVVAYCLIYKNVSIEDFKRIVAWDLEIGSDIFRNNDLPVLLYACDSALIENHAFKKMQWLVERHGPGIMSWTSSSDHRTNVNIFLQRGYIMNTEGCFRMHKKLAFMINSCPAALKKYTMVGSQKRNAFTTILDRCSNVNDERHEMIVRYVFQHLEIADLYEEYDTACKHTLLDLVGTSGNALVAQYLQRKFADEKLAIFSS